MNAPILERSLRCHKDCITSVSFNPSSNLSYRKEPIEQLASSSLDGTLTISTLTHCLNDCQTGSYGPCSCNKEIKTFRFFGHTGPVHRVSYSPSGHLLASCSSDNTVRLWTPSVHGKSVAVKGHKAPVRFIDFSLSESLMATCSDDKTLKLWKLPDCSFQKSLLGHTHWVRTCRFCQDPNICASGSDDGTVRLWDIERGDNIVTYNIEAKDSTSLPCVMLVDFHPSNYILGASSTDGIIRLYDIRNDKVVQTCRPWGQLKHEIRAKPSSCGISFEPSGKGLLMSSRNYSSLDAAQFSFWDMRNQQVVYTVQHKEEIKPKDLSLPLPVSFSPNGSSFSSGCNDGSLLLWKNNKMVRRNKVSIATRRSHVKNVPVSTEVTSTTEPCASVPSSNSVSSIEDSKPIESFATNNEWSSVNKPCLDSEKNIGTCPADVLIGSLQHIVGQLSLITQTVELIEQRVTIIEDNIIKFHGQSKEV